MDWAAGRLQPQLKPGLDAHLTECERCCEYIAGLAQHGELPALTPTSLFDVSALPIDSEEGRKTVRLGPKEASRLAEQSSELAPTRMRNDKAAPPSTEPAKVGSSVGRYIVLSELGEGGMGQVFAAYDPELDRKVALKLIRTDIERAGTNLSTRLQREAQAMARLSHPNVCSVFDVGTHRGQVFIAMEFIAGVPLSKWLTQSNRRWRDILEVFIAAGNGLAAAHEAGIVHRDFKPDNVLVGNDGVVRVLDFGLARPSSDSRPPEAQPTRVPSANGNERPIIDTPLTVEGAFMGTPAYMAPEQYRAAAVEAPADQFSFGVSLFEALYGARPFKPSAVRDFASGTLNKLEPSIPSDSKVPAWVRRALVKAVAAEPQARFPSVRALLDALEHDPARTRRRWMLGAALALIAVGTVAGATYSLKAQERACAEMPAKWTVLWNSSRRAALGTAFEQTGKPFASATWATTAPIIDSYLSQWAEQRQDNCLATKVRGEQSDTLLDRRVECLDQRLTEAATLLDMFSKADGATVEKAVAAAQSLTPLRRCADSRELLSEVERPKNEASRARVEVLRAVLSKGKALTDLGRFSEALALVEGQDTAVRDAAYAPLLGEFLAQRGDLLQKAGNNAAAEKMLYEASWTAVSSKDLTTQAKALTALSVTLLEQGRPDEALRWGQFANAAIAALGGDALLQGRLHHVLGNLFAQKGDREQALAHLGLCLSLREQQLGGSNLLVATTRSAYGTELHRGGKLDEAVAHHRKAVDAIIAAEGPRHPSLVTAYDGLASALSAQEQHEEALTVRRAALDVAESALGRKDVRTATTRAAWAKELALARRDEEAIAAQHEVVDDLLASAGDQSALTADAHLTLAQMLTRQRQADEASQQFNAAITVAQNVYGKTSVRLSPYLVGAAEAWVELKLNRHALPALEKANAIYEQAQARGVEVARAQFALAKLLFMNRGSHSRITELGTKAVEGFKAAKATEQASEASSWLATTARQARGVKKR